VKDAYRGIAGMEKNGSSQHSASHKQQQAYARTQENQKQMVNTGMINRKVGCEQQR
jgi:hypothetical protein